MMNESGLTLTVKETSKLMGLSLGLTYQQIRENKIPHLRFGGRILVLKRALFDLLEGKSSEQKSNQDENDQYIPD